LEKANKTAGESSARLTELQKKVAEAESDRAKLQTNLDEANSEIERLRTEPPPIPTNPSQDGNLISAPPVQ